MTLLIDVIKQLNQSVYGNNLSKKTVVKYFYKFGHKSNNQNVQSNQWHASILKWK